MSQLHTSPLHSHFKILRYHEAFVRKNKSSPRPSSKTESTMHPKQAQDNNHDKIPAISNLGGPDHISLDLYEKVYTAISARKNEWLDSEICMLHAQWTNETAHMMRHMHNYRRPAEHPPTGSCSLILLVINAVIEFQSSFLPSVQCTSSVFIVEESPLNHYYIHSYCIYIQLTGNSADLYKSVINNQIFSIERPP